MKRFLRRLLLFLAPLSVVLLPVWGLIISGEILINCKKIASDKGTYIFGLAYTEVGRQFKLLNVAEKEKFDVLAIGSSRVMQFRAEMFNTSFYNAGGVTQSIGEFQDFLQEVPVSKLPNIIIVGLDQWMFNTDYQTIYESDNGPVDWHNTSEINRNLGKKVKDFARDWRNGKIHGLFAESGYKRYGISAYVDSSGFRNDGSYLYTSSIRKIAREDTSFYDFRFKTTLGRIRRGCCRFNYGHDVDHGAILRLNSLLAFCKTHKIEVVAFLPPFASRVYQELVNSGNFSYMNKIYTSIKPIFDKYDFEVYDFIHPVDNNGSNNGEMIDGFHGGEVVYVKILIRMLELGSKLNEVADAGKLRSDLMKPQNRFIVYDY